MLFGKVTMTEGEELEEDSVELPPQNRQKSKMMICQRCIPVLIILVLLGGAGAITWYFLGNKRNTSFFVFLIPILGVKERKCSGKALQGEESV